MSKSFDLPFCCAQISLLASSHKILNPTNMKERFSISSCMTDSENQSAKSRHISANGCVSVFLPEQLEVELSLLILS